MGYIHDLSAYVGKRFVDKNDEAELNSNFIYYGKIPQDIIDMYNEKYANLIKLQPLLFNPILGSIKKSL
jgi:hypothetical protein